MKIVFVIMTVIIVIGSGVYFAAPYLKPSNGAFAPQTPTAEVSPRLKGIFSGMKAGFSN